MRYILLAISILILTSCGNPDTNQPSKDDMAARLKASHDRFQHEKSPEGQAELAKKAGF